MRISDWSSDVCSSDLPNLANAYVFARLGAREGSASIALLEQQIAARLPADEVAQADSLYAGELGARPSAYRIPQTMLAEAAAIAAEHGVQIAAVDNVETGAETKTATDEGAAPRSEEHTSELQSLMRISYA